MTRQEESRRRHEIMTDRLPEDDEVLMKLDVIVNDARTYRITANDAYRKIREALPAGGLVKDSDECPANLVSGRHVRAPLDHVCIHCGKRL